MAATKTKTTGARDVDDYLSRLPDEPRAALEKLRQTIKSYVPGATEVISYQIPTFKYQERMLVSYAAFKEHCSFFPGAAPIEAHRDELKSYQTSKGTIGISSLAKEPSSIHGSPAKYAFSCSA